MISWVRCIWILQQLQWLWFFMGVHMYVGGRDEEVGGGREGEAFGVI